METKFTQQEILLRTDTQFAQQHWVESDDQEALHLTSVQRLERACWNGLVKQMIPELDITLGSKRKIWLWHVHETNAFLALDFFEYPEPKEMDSSIDPYLFMTWLRNN